MDRLLTVWKDTPKPHQLLIVGGFLLLLLLLMGGAAGFVSAWKDARFQKQVEGMKAERDALTQKADAAEERAKATEAEKVKYQIALEIAGKDADKAMEKVNAAETEFNKEMERIGVDVGAVERCRHLCAKFNLKPEQCDCSEAR